MLKILTVGLTTLQYLEYLLQ